MYQIPQKRKLSTKLVLGVFVLMVFLSYNLAIFSLRATNSFFDAYYLKFNQVVQVKFSWPVEVKKKNNNRSFKVVPQVLAEELPTPTPIPANPTDVDIANYIKSKPWPYSVAIRLAKSENFWNKTHSFDCRREGGLNSNGTRDHGLWQINDIHINSGKISLEDTLDCFKATDFAYQLYKDWGGFTPWSAYNNGSYLNHTEI